MNPATPPLDTYIVKIYSPSMKESFSNITGFDWDEGNRDKNRIKHNVSTGEAEQIFFNEPLIVLDDEKHSDKEQRYAAFGITDKGRTLVIIFTIRSSKLRIISARDMTRQERAFYDN